jgi:hypothetical protein
MLNRRLNGTDRKAQTSRPDDGQIVLARPLGAKSYLRCRYNKAADEFVRVDGDGKDVLARVGSHVSAIVPHVYAWRPTKP